ncbi:hypothetical protein [Actinomycetospora lemnae]|uniref:Uncharacterized protein n=1 Tax=Actinomycetospora lemnae TaxID=3019891 RepID=A0ABT5T1T3_9PSEU|nr:hypothetical protein [Actinomycetospora sp. DW7H6]MDD7968959.1 hypothetical protein [Actinomycetospora sp. DW7H6]
MTATTSISTGAGEEIVSVHVEDEDPFAVLTLGRQTAVLTRDECRRIADALRAASLRHPPR